MKFDIIVGNPPYQEDAVGGTKLTKPLYHRFIEKSIELSKQYVCLITPSRWFVGGTGLDKFRLMMQYRTDIKKIIHTDDAKKYFKGVSIAGGVSYCLIDKEYNGPCFINGVENKLNKYDIIIKNTENYSIIDKIKEIEKIDILYKSRLFGIWTNDKRLHDKEEPNDIRCHVSRTKGFIKYINKDEVRNKSDLNKYKCGVQSVGTDCGLDNIIIINSNEVCTESYLTFSFDSYIECVNFKNYLNTNFVKFLIKERKNTHIVSSVNFKFVPLLDFTEEWADEKLYKKFGLTEEEIKIVEGINA
jgi:site-specific DNA-methyltransferase (adenine-specific)